MKFAGRIDRLQPSLVRDILAVASRPEVISFAGGLPAAEVMPAPDMGDIPVAARQYGATEGEPVLREVVARRLGESGLHVDPEQVLITSGSQQGIDLVSKLFIDEDAPVVVEAPTYLAALQSFTLFGARYRVLALDDEGPVPGAITAAAKGGQPRCAYLIPDFQNPSSCCYTRERREAVARELAATGVPLVEDAPYRDLVYDPVDRTPLASLLPDDHPWIYLGSFSKVAVPSLRIGYAACSPSLYPLLGRLKQACDLHTARPPQLWLARFVDGDAYPAHLERLRAFYRERRDAMADALTRHLGGAAGWSLPAGGLFFWARLTGCGINTMEVLPRALARGVAFMPGEPFFTGGDDGRHLRLSFSHAPPARIEAGVERLAALLEAPAGVRAGNF